MKRSGNRKVVLIGSGSVGVAYAFAMVNQCLCDEFVIIDIAQDRALGEVKDLNHGVPYAISPTRVKAGEYKDCAGADLVVLCAGVAQKPGGETRLELGSRNVNIFRTLVANVVKSGFEGIFLVATNPVDVLAHATQYFSGFPYKRVIGSGTILDTARLRYLLGEHFGVSPQSVHADVIGEHGDSELVAWSTATIAGRSIKAIFEADPTKKHLLDEIYVQTRDAAYDIIKAKGMTCYGIGMGLARITRAILNNENAVLNVSAYLEGHYNHKDVYIGVPAVVNRDGLHDILEIPLDAQEREKFAKSVQTLKDIRNDLLAI